MNPLKIALVIRNREYLMNRNERSIGLFSYAVPEFEWAHFRLGKFAPLKREEFEDFDVIVIEDGAHVNVEGHGPPVVGIFWDTNSDESHFAHRLVQASQCDLVFIGQDPLERFVACRKPVKRLTYCVNDRQFRDYGEEKTVDVGFHMSQFPNRPRTEALAQLKAWAVANHGVILSARKIMLLNEYVRAFNRAKVSINVSQMPENRPHRLFDAMACRSCVASTPQPFVEEEHSPVAGEHYLLLDPEQIGETLSPVFENGAWQSMTEVGYEFIREHHTWEKRAPELRQLMETAL